MKSVFSRIRLNSVASVRLAVVIVFVAFIAAFALTQYDTVRDTVRFICISCLGLSS